MDRTAILCCAITTAFACNALAALQVTGGYLRTFSRDGIGTGFYDPLRQQFTSTISQSPLQGIQSQSISTQGAGVDLTGTLQLTRDLISFWGTCSPTSDMGIAAVIHFTVDEATDVGIRVPLNPDGLAGSLGTLGYAQDMLWLTASSGEVVAGYGYYTRQDQYGSATGSGVWGVGGFQQNLFDYSLRGTIAPGDYTLELVAERTAGSQPYWEPVFGLEVGFGANVPAPATAPLLALAGLTARGRRRK